MFLVVLSNMFFVSIISVTYNLYACKVSFLNYLYVFLNLEKRVPDVKHAKNCYKPLPQRHLQVYILMLPAFNVALAGFTTQLSLPWPWPLSYLYYRMKMRSPRTSYIRLPMSYWPQSVPMYPDFTCWIRYGHTIPFVDKYYL